MIMEIIERTHNGEPYTAILLDDSEIQWINEIREEMKIQRNLGFL